MGSLTLEQVREAGRFATVTAHHYTFAHIPPDDYRVWNEAHDVMIDASLTVHLDRCVVLDSRWPLHGDLFGGGIESLHPPVDGWRHIAGCDCPYCKET